MARITSPSVINPFSQAFTSWKISLLAFVSLLMVDENVDNSIRLFISSILNFAYSFTNLFIKSPFFRLFFLSSAFFGLGTVCGCITEPRRAELLLLSTIINFFETTINFVTNIAIKIDAFSIRTPCKFDFSFSGINPNIWTT